LKLECDEGDECSFCLLYFLPFQQHLSRRQDPLQVSFVSPSLSITVRSIIELVKCLSEKRLIGRKTRHLHVGWRMTASMADCGMAFFLGVHLVRAHQSQPTKIALPRYTHCLLYKLL
jgi:hypothetical protein